MLVFFSSILPFAITWIPSLCFAQLSLWSIALVFAVFQEPSELLKITLNAHSRVFQLELEGCLMADSLRRVLPGQVGRAESSCWHSWSEETVGFISVAVSMDTVVIKPTCKWLEITWEVKIIEFQYSSMCPKIIDSCKNISWSTMCCASRKGTFADELVFLWEYYHLLISHGQSYSFETLAVLSLCSHSLRTIQALWHELVHQKNGSQHWKPIASLSGHNLCISVYVSLTYTGKLECR